MRPPHLHALFVLSFAIVACGMESTTSSSDSGAFDAAPSSATDAGAVSTGTFGGARAGTIVPLYTYPTDASWSSLIAAKRAHPTVPVVAIVNPADGVGTSADASYASGIDRLRAAGVVVLGYVTTTYGKRAASDVESEVDRYRSWYATDGIFFDEMANTRGLESYYGALSGYAKSKGATMTVGNPGTDTVASYVGIVDTLMIYESAGLPNLASLSGWHDAYPKDNFAIIPYAAGFDAMFVRLAAAHVGWIYITDDGLPNPWDTLPASFDALLGALE